jgi:hypothetical protein
MSQEDDTHQNQLRKLAYQIINSSTCLLPAWKKILRSQGKSIRLLPRDVRTRWNSTHEMLDFAVEHKQAINFLMQDPENGLRDLELSSKEWEIARQLRDILKASHMFSHCTVSDSTTDIPIWYGLLLQGLCKPCNGHPGDGPPRQTPCNGLSR